MSKRCVQGTLRLYPVTKTTGVPPSSAFGTGALRLFNMSPCFSYRRFAPGFDCFEAPVGSFRWSPEVSEWSRTPSIWRVGLDDSKRLCKWTPSWGVYRIYWHPKKALVCLVRLCGRHGWFWKSLSVVTFADCQNRYFLRFSFPRTHPLWGEKEALEVSVT